MPDKPLIKLSAEAREAIREHARSFPTDDAGLPSAELHEWSAVFALSALEDLEEAVQRMIYAREVGDKAAATAYWQWLHAWAHAERGAEDLPPYPSIPRGYAS